MDISSGQNKLKSDYQLNLTISDYNSECQTVQLRYQKTQIKVSCSTPPYVLGTALMAMWVNPRK